MTRLPHRTPLLLIALTAGCGASAAPPPDTADEPAIEAVAVESVTVNVPLSFPAQLYVERDAMVHARSEGTVQWLGADLGMTVRAGQVLARLESTDQEIAAARAEDVYQTALKAAQRQRELTAREVSTAEELERTESELKRAELDLRQARRDLELTRVVAPFAGVVSARYARAGRLATSGDSLFRITALSPMLAAVQIPESDATGLGRGSGAEVIGNGGAGTARVIRVGPVVDAASGTRQFVLELGEGRGLRPGGAVTVRIGSVRRSALAIPSDAVGDGGLVMVMEGGRATARAVALGADLGDGLTEVLSGLAPGERVVRAAR